MAQEGSEDGTGRHPPLQGGLFLWHKRAVKIAPEDIPIAKEGCPYGTRGQCIWHRKTSPLQRRAVPMAQEGTVYGTGRHPPLQRRAVLMAQEGSEDGTGRHPHCKGGLSLWHRRAVHKAQDCRHGTGRQPHGKEGLDVPMTQKASPWQTRAVPMAQEISLHGTGGLSPWHRRASPWHSINPSDERKSPAHTHRHALAGIRFRTTNHTTARGISKMQAT